MPSLSQVAASALAFVYWVCTICLLSLHQIEDKWHKRWLVCEERCKQHFGLLHMIVDRCLPWICTRRAGANQCKRMDASSRCCTSKCLERPRLWHLVIASLKNSEFLLMMVRLSLNHWALGSLLWLPYTSWGIRQTARTGTALQIGGKSNSKIFQASANLGTTLDPQGPRKRSTPCKIIVWLYTAKARVLQRDNDSWNSQAGHDCTNIA